VSNFVDRGVSRVQRGGSPTVVNLSFLYRDELIPNNPKMFHINHTENYKTYGAPYTSRMFLLSLEKKDIFDSA
jgi:hypothetical protein